MGETSEAVFKTWHNKCGEPFYISRAHTRHRAQCAPALEVAEGEVAAFILTVRGSRNETKMLIKNRMTITEFRGFRRLALVQYSVFQSALVGVYLGIGDTFRFWGKLTL